MHFIIFMASTVEANANLSLCESFDNSLSSRVLVSSSCKIIVSSAIKGEALEVVIIITHTVELEIDRDDELMLRIMSLELVKTKKTFNSGTSRFVYVDEENDITICDATNGKRAIFTASRWVKFVEEIQNIDRAIEHAITLKPTDYKVHLGGNWYVTVTDEIPIVDFRRWYMPSNENTLQATPVSIVLTYTQWNSLKTVAKELKEDFNDVESC